MLVAGAGCNKQPYGCVPVSGKVTYEDGSLIPAEQIRVKFLSQAPALDPKVHPREGVAKVDVKTGAFDSVTTYAAKDGIVPGEHKVLIECFSEGQMRSDLVPREYADLRKTPLTVDSSKSPFELKVPKPKSS
jgi:hypothetical protein